MGVILIEGNARALEMACAHSQDEANARNFEGDMSLKKNDPKRVATIRHHSCNSVKKQSSIEMTEAKAKTIFILDINNNNSDDDDDELL